MQTPNLKKVNYIYLTAGWPVEQKRTHRAISVATLCFFFQLFLTLRNDLINSEKEDRPSSKIMLEGLSLARMDSWDTGVLGSIENGEN